MIYQLGKASLAELEGVHPAAAAIPKRAIQLTTQDFSVHDGLRTLAEQKEYVRRGVSWTMNSLHLKQPDGWGHAFDLVPWINGQLRWEWGPIYVIAKAVHQAAVEQHTRLIWGGVWDRIFNDLDPNQLEKEVEAYVARRKQIGKKAAIDGPHWQLA